MTLKKVKKGLVICETDIEMAIEFILRDPQTYPHNMPKAWTKQKFLDHIKDSLDESEIKIKSGESFLVGYQIWGHIGSVGLDLAGSNRDISNYQLYLSIRTASTNPNKMVNLT